jgi:flagellar M-ring protein FliF
MDSAQRLWKQAAEFWKGQSQSRRVLIGSGSVLALVAAVAVAYYSYRGDYRVLFAGLPVDEAGTVTAKLQTLGVSYRLANSGTTVLVPADQVQQARVSLAADGLPSRGGKGLELFDESPMGTTPFVQGVNYTRALQGELARSIMQLDPVSSARVLIAKPDSSPFVRDQKPVTASVVLRLKPGATFNRSTAAAVVALVARGVEGLAPENVTLVDSAGRVLSEQHDPDNEGAAATQLEYRRDLETHLAAQAEEMLARTVGFGRAIVRVSADVNFRRTKERKETYNPEEKVVASEKVVNSKAAGGSSRGGVAGVASNSGSKPSGGGAGGGNSQEETLQTEYMVSKTTLDSEDRTGTVDRLTVAAMIDLSPAEGGGEPPLSLEEARDIIKDAVGFKTGRDEIKVTNVKLASAVTTEPDEEAVALQRFQNYVVMARNISLGLSGLLAVVLGFLLLRRLRPRIVKPVPAPAEADAVPASDMAELAELIKRDPELIARALVGMMSE